MDHAEVQAWLEEAFFRPGVLRQLDEGPGDGDPQPASVRDHLRDCAACRQELRSLRTTSVALDVGLGPSRTFEERMLANVRQLGRQGGAGRPTFATAPALPLPARSSVLRAAAVLLLAFVAFGAGALLGFGLPTAEPPAGPRLQQAAVVFSDLMNEPDARHVELLDTSDAPAGMVVHSVARQELAVMSSALERPADGRYDCYLEREGERTLIGPMHFDGETAFWAGPVGGPPDAGRAGDRFVVMLEGRDEAVLWGQF
ncbi:hypothetical protein BH24CHL6_BH24CHL6_06770 [soil metagenome]